MKTSLLVSIVSLVAVALSAILISTIITPLNQDQVKTPPQTPPTSTTVPSTTIPPTTPPSPTTVPQYDRYVFIGDDELTITVVSLIMNRLNEYPPVLAKMYNITHYPDFRAISPQSLSGVGWIMFSGDYLSKVLRDEELREAFAQFLREVHLARGGRGLYVAFGNNSHLLFDAFCLAGIYFDEVVCALYRNPISYDTLIVEIVFADYSRVTSIYTIGMPLDGAWTPEDIVDHIVPRWPLQMDIYSSETVVNT
ncbi:MAG: hypothetical protein ACO2OR_03795 [Desulfurococcaceae archaeon]